VREATECAQRRQAEAELLEASAGEDGVWAAAAPASSSSSSYDAAAVAPLQVFNTSKQELEGDDDNDEDFNFLDVHIPGHSTTAPWEWPMTKQERTARAYLIQETQMDAALDQLDALEDELERWRELGELQELEEAKLSQ